MLSYLIGKITETDENFITLETANVGYNVQISKKASDIFTGILDEIKLYVYLQVKEDGFSLFGFCDKDEKELFLKLISVSGVGPKGAMTILSNIAYQDLCNVIYSQDINSLSSVKGVGKKTAERILIELKDKVFPAGNITSVTNQISSNSQIEDACDVLCSLGISRTEALRLCEMVYSENDQAEDIITKALAKR